MRLSAKYIKAIEGKKVEILLVGGNVVKGIVEKTSIKGQVKVADRDSNPIHSRFWQILREDISAIATIGEK